MFFRVIGVAVIMETFPNWIQEMKLFSRLEEQKMLTNKIVVYKLQYIIKSYAKVE